MEPRIASEFWPYDQARNAVVFTLRRIIFSGAPILYISHDLDDHGWQFLDGEPANDTDAVIVRMDEIVDIDPTVTDVANLAPGWIAERSFVGDVWRRRRHHGHLNGDNFNDPQRTE